MGLIEQLATAKGPAKKAAQQALIALGAGAVPVILEALASGALPTRKAAAKAIADVANANVDVLEAVKCAVRDPDKAVRVAAIKVVTGLPPSARLVASLAPAADFDDKAFAGGGEKISVVKQPTNDALFHALRAAGEAGADAIRELAAVEHPRAVAGTLVLLYWAEFRPPAAPIGPMASAALFDVLGRLSPEDAKLGASALTFLMPASDALPIWRAALAGQTHERVAEAVRERILAAETPTLEDPAEAVAFALATARDESAESEARVDALRALQDAGKDLTPAEPYENLPTGPVDPATVQLFAELAAAPGAVEVRIAAAVAYFQTGGARRPEAAEIADHWAASAREMGVGVAGDGRWLPPRLPMTSAALDVVQTLVRDNPPNPGASQGRADILLTLWSTSPYQLATLCRLGLELRAVGASPRAAVFGDAPLEPELEMLAHAVLPVGTVMDSTALVVGTWGFTPVPAVLASQFPELAGVALVQVIGFEDQTMAVRLDGAHLRRAAIKLTRDSAIVVPGLWDAVVPDPGALGLVAAELDRLGADRSRVGDDRARGATARALAALVWPANHRLQAIDKKKGWHSSWLDDREVRLTAVIPLDGELPKTLQGRRLLEFARDVRDGKDSIHVIAVEDNDSRNPWVSMYDWEEPSDDLVFPRIRLLDFLRGLAPV